MRKQIKNVFLWFAIEKRRPTNNASPHEATMRYLPTVILMRSGFRSQEILYESTIIKKEVARGTKTFLSFRYDHKRRTAVMNIYPPIMVVKSCEVWYGYSIAIFKI